LTTARYLGNFAGYRITSDGFGGWTVTDRNTGRTSFTDVGQDGGTFSRAVNQMDSQRRRSGFGNIMFV
jgi:hypothetical protein